jgi:hypothetical protein
MSDFICRFAITPAAAMGSRVFLPMLIVSGTAYTEARSPSPSDLTRIVLQNA